MVILFFSSFIALAQNQSDSSSARFNFSLLEFGYIPSLLQSMSEKEEGVYRIQSFALQYFKEHKKRIVINGKVFPTDCSNFVRAVYFAALNKDVFAEAEEEEVMEPGSNSGVETIYNLFDAKYKIKTEPAKGDIIFFHNSYDKNRNRKWDDLFTHAAVVIDVEEDGTIVFIHGGTGRGIAKDYMNLKYPHLHVKDGRIINSYLQRNYKWMKTAPKLTAELFHAFGEVE